MRHTPHYLLTDIDEIKRLVRENPWATIIAHTAKGLVASHYPVLLDEEKDDIHLLSHVGRPDDRNLELGSAEVLVIIQGPHGYVSSSWYGGVDSASTWNHATAHLYGVPEILSDEENWAVLSRLTRHFEQHVEHPKYLEDMEEYGRREMAGTVGFRLPVTRFDARLKLSQNKPAQTVDEIVHQLDEGAAYRNKRLVGEMRRVHGQES